MRSTVVDDDPMIVMALKTILGAEREVQICGSGNSGAEAVTLYEEHRPDVLLMDIRMEGMSGLEASEEILKRHPEAKVLLLTTFLDDEYIVRAIRAGARGYLLKQDYASILPALRAVQSGQTVFGSEIMTRIPELFQRKGGSGVRAAELTEREAELISLVAEGLSNREIAGRMYLGEGTVRNYLSNILDKLGLRDRTQLAVWYYRGRKEIE